MPRQVEQSVSGRRIAILDPNQRTAIVNLIGSDWPLFAPSNEIYIISAASCPTRTAIPHLGLKSRIQNSTHNSDPYSIYLPADHLHAR